MPSDLFLITDVPVPDPASGSHHAGVDSLLGLMAAQGLFLHRSARPGPLAGPQGLVAPDDLVLVKVNAQWKYRGCTNSDVLRGLIQRLLEHPEGFRGEVVIFDNGQGQGSMEGTARGWGRYGDDPSVQANAEDPRHTFAYLADTAFAGRGVSTCLLDPIRDVIIADDDHRTDGYRLYEGVSYPCFTTQGGHREGLWEGGRHHHDRLKLINLPVLKVHAGAGVTACLKSYYGVLSMGRPPRDHHFGEAGQVWGEMIARVRAPVLNVLDCIWVSLRNHYGYPPANTRRLNRLLGGTDPVAIDYWASKYVLHPLTGEPAQHPDHPDSLINRHLSQAQEVINRHGGIAGRPVTRDEAEMRLLITRSGGAEP